MTKKAKKTLFTVLQLAIFIGLGIFLIWYMYHSMKPDDKKAMLQSMREANLLYLIPVLFVGFFSHYFRALRWRLLLEPLSIFPTRMNTFCAVMIGYMVNAILPRVGEVAKCTVLARYEKVPADKMVGTIVAERAFDLVCLIIVLVIGFAFEGKVLLRFMQERFGESGHTALYVLGGLVLVILLILVFYQRIKRTKVGHAIKGVADGVRTIMHLRHRGLFIVYTFAIWICYTGMIFLGFKAMEATHLLSPMVAVITLGFGAIGMIITPGGIGAYQGVIQKLLPLFGVAVGPALGFGWLSWSAQTGVIMLLGLISLVLLPIYNRTPHNAQIAVDTKPDL